jgi:hypothetical protein
MKFQSLNQFKWILEKWKGILKQNLVPGPKITARDGFIGRTACCQPGRPSTQ